MIWADCRGFEYTQKVVLYKKIECFLNKSLNQPQIVTLVYIKDPSFQVYKNKVT